MSDRNWLLLALVLSAAIRLTLVFLIYPDTSILTANDQALYLDLADKLRNGSGFGPGFGSERLPLYPLFLAGMQLLTGNLFVILAAQHLHSL